MCRDSERTRTTGSDLRESGPGIFGRDYAWKRRGVGQPGKRAILYEGAEGRQVRQSAFSARIWVVVWPMWCFRFWLAPAFDLLKLGNPK